MGDPINWSNWDALLGTVSDRELARRIGCSRISVFSRRKKLGIPAYGYKLDLPNAHQLLGKKTDVEIAGMLGCCITTVRHRRLKLGIPRHQQENYNWSLVENLWDRLGNNEIASIVGCHPHSVWVRRKKLGLPSPPPQERNGVVKAATPKTTTRRRSSRGRWGEQEIAIITTLPVFVSRILLPARSYDAIRRKLREIAATPPSLRDWAVRMAEESLGMDRGENQTAATSKIGATS